ncbi:hypothetical protein ACJX0J_017752, partial [Zea mays]
SKILFISISIFQDIFDGVFNKKYFGILLTPPKLLMIFSDLLNNNSKYVRREAVHGEAPGQAVHVRGGLAEPQPVGVHGVPGAVGVPAGEEVRHMGGPARRLPRLGVQRDGGVLLGAVPCGVELGRPQDPQHPAPDHQGGHDRGARRELARRGLPRLQHLHVVDEHAGHESHETGRQELGGARRGGADRSVPEGADDVGELGERQRRPGAHVRLLHEHVSSPYQ